MKNYATILLALFLLLALTAFPELIYAAEKEAINPPGWLGGFLAFLSVALAAAAWLWVRNKQP